MSGFLSPLVIRALSPAELKAKGSSSQLYCLTEPFAYQSDLFGATVTVPAGFVTDFASIPRVVWAWMDPEDPVILFPSAVHDYNYTTGLITREEADSMLKEGMAACGASGFDQAVVYRAVRMFGGSHWKTP